MDQVFENIYIGNYKAASVSIEKALFGHIGIKIVIGFRPLISWNQLG